MKTLNFQILDKHQYKIGLQGEGKKGVSTTVLCP